MQKEMFKEWVKAQLKQGRSKEAIKQHLYNKGHSPKIISLVDQVFYETAKPIKKSVFLEILLAVSALLTVMAIGFFIGKSISYQPAQPIGLEPKEASWKFLAYSGNLEFFNGNLAAFDNNSFTISENSLELTVNNDALYPTEYFYNFRNGSKVAVSKSDINVGDFITIHTVVEDGTKTREVRRILVNKFS